MIRHEALATLTRWREVALAAIVVTFGLWTATRGGPVLLAVGLGMAGLGAALTLTALRRMRFAQAVAAPGLVEVVEGEVRFFGPTFGGAVSLDDLTEIRLLTMRGRRLWRLKQSDGQALLIPVDAAGAEALYDGFTSLPGMDMAALLAQLAPARQDAPQGAALVGASQTAMTLIWHRKGKGIVA